MPVVYRYSIKKDRNISNEIKETLQCILLVLLFQLGITFISYYVANNVFEDKFANSIKNLNKDKLILFVISNIIFLFGATFIII